ncbi:MAG: histidine kinase dimerization/phospho-acceptor domain-containing protein [Myxococcota bacterium]
MALSRARGCAAIPGRAQQNALDWILATVDRLPFNMLLFDRSNRLLAMTGFEFRTLFGDSLRELTFDEVLKRFDGGKSLSSIVGSELSEDEVFVRLAGGASEQLYCVTAVGLDPGTYRGAWALVFEEAFQKALRLDRLAQRTHNPQLLKQRASVILRRLSSETAHHINNPLTYMAASLDWIAESMVEPPAAKDVLQALRDLRNGMERIQGIVDKLTELARQGSFGGDELLGDPFAHSG